MGFALGRVTRSRQGAKANYNRISRWYDSLAGHSEKRCKEAALQKLNAKKGEVVLEIGFGTGDSVLALAQSVGDQGRVCGVDISDQMLKITDRKVRRALLSHRVDLSCGDALNLPYAPSFFDAIFMSFTLELFDTPEIAMILGECSRILRIGGRVCIVSMSDREKATVILTIYEWMHAKFPSYVDCHPISAKRTLREAGFAILDAKEMSMWGLPVDVTLAAQPPQVQTTANRATVQVPPQSFLGAEGSHGAHPG